MHCGHSVRHCSAHGCSTVVCAWTLCNCFFRTRCLLSGYFPPRPASGYTCLLFAVGQLHGNSPRSQSNCQASRPAHQTAADAGFWILWWVLSLFRLPVSAASGPGALFGCSGWNRRLGVAHRPAGCWWSCGGRGPQPAQRGIRRSRPSFHQAHLIPSHAHFRCASTVLGPSLSPHLRETDSCTTHFAFSSMPHRPPLRHCILLDDGQPLPLGPVIQPYWKDDMDHPMPVKTLRALQAGRLAGASASTLSRRRGSTHFYVLVGACGTA